jgi:carbon-monoxide dehydrogenase medium subunit
MLADTKVCLYPQSPAEAVRILERSDKRALILAGGTTASLSRDPNVDTLVDLTRMGFDRIERSDDDWSLGCNVRIQQLAEHQGLKELWNGMLTQAACSVGSRPIRNAVTVGGNTVALFRWSDPPVAYLAMNASFDFFGPEGERTLGADEFFSRHPRKLLGPAELLIRVRIPRVPGRHGGAFTKFARTAFDLAVVDAAVCLNFDNDKCTQARVVVGATRNMPWRAKEAEQKLTGARLTDKLINVAARAARQATRTADDIRTSRAYREQMVEVIVGRTIRQALDNREQKS